MLDDILNSDNPMVKYGFAALICFGGLYFVASIGIVPVRYVWFISVLAFLSILQFYVGKQRATFRPERG